MALSLSNVEIDVTKQDQLQDACLLAVKHHVQAIVVTPDLVPASIIMRGIKAGKFSIIALIDCPKGEQYSRDKFRGIPAEALNADGYEILLTARPTQSEIISEVKYLSDFCRTYLSTPEIRFILNLDNPPRSRDTIKHMLLACRQIPMPSMIRNTCLTKVPPGNASKDAFDNQYKFINEHFRCKIKMSGNITPEIYKTIKSDKFTVTLQQAQNIIKESNIKKEIK